MIRKKLANFVGATDSAVPCAILLDVAKDLAQKLKKGTTHTLQLIFFDGEEAFGQWTATDSIYGSRHLATKMKNTNVPGQNNLNQLDAMDMFVLLDLIGHKQVQFHNFFDKATGTYYNRLKNIEKELFASYITSNSNGRRQTVFSSTPQHSYIEDDHIPFMNYDVPILHLISSPFPPDWHRATDDEAHLDFQAIDHIRNIMKIFVIEYLHLKQDFC